MLSSAPSRDGNCLLFSAGRDGGLRSPEETQQTDGTRTGLPRQGWGSQGHSDSTHCQTQVPEAQNQAFLKSPPSLVTPAHTAVSWWCRCQAGPAAPLTQALQPTPLIPPDHSPPDRLPPPSHPAASTAAPFNPQSLNWLRAHSQPTPLKPANGLPPRAFSDHYPQSQRSSRCAGWMSLVCPPTPLDKGTPFVPMGQH